MIQGKFTTIYYYDSPNPFVNLVDGMLHLAQTLIQKYWQKMRREHVKLNSLPDKGVQTYFFIRHVIPEHGKCPGNFFFVF